MSDFDLKTRLGLPEELIALLPEMQREEWAAHKDFGGLPVFWLSIHTGLRDLSRSVLTDTEAMLDRSIGVEEYHRRLRRFGNMLLKHLQSHHEIEDNVFFPRLIQLDQRLKPGLDMLEADHVELDRQLSEFWARTSHALRALSEPSVEPRLAVNQVRSVLLRFDKLLERHLVDEEDVVIPLLLKHGLVDPE
ncbi:hemerythrin domain-containing protein [Chachezhania sediminis]|uniref:hemerythrin domain-containing protein n=1 Tax=Chachezhania sediminis TaxID=2599291 RepID=UPI00131ACC9C|nr:hemerythrin domain-containing protein [Chachezhania sediminis]